ncbi:hypothetical protein [Chitinophaga polysaccharea]|uniref:hypothetical protein n=1 Tax=Chitinophaga polysaccharea TaxID=1293035 RepID=UPI001158841B|nr:hypothetical protein [Chitinophaga polysaccharea]
MVIALGRYEEQASNINAITKTFDWNVGFTIKWNPQGNAVNLADFSGGPNTFEYEIKAGSVYGAAKYYGNWKGARVEKK